MPSEPYSKKISPEARVALTEFAIAYIDTMGSTTEAAAEEAKRKAVELLTQTDVDIIVFVLLAATICAPPSAMLIHASLMGRLSRPEAASSLVAILESAIRIDKQRRTS